MTRGLTRPASTVADLAGTTRPGVVSTVARSAARNLLDLPVPLRRATIATLDDRDRRFVFLETLRETGSLYGLWHDTPSGFVEDVIGETVWSKQRELIDSVPHNKRTIVPAGFGVGKTFIAGRLVAWAGSVNPPGTMVIVTTATRFRQVRYQLWPHIRTAVAKAKLPGHCDTTQWKQQDLNGNEVVVAYGFSAPDNDEAAMQGIHGTPKLGLVVDEAGGISKMIGRGTNNLLTGDAWMLAIGNPPMDDPGSWFEDMSKEGEDPEKRGTVTIRIAATDSPAITGEPTPICRACVPNIDGHTIAGGVPSHLPDHEWLDRTLEEYGDREHPYVVAKVYARFPKDSGHKVIPSSWVELAEKNEMAPDQAAAAVRLRDLGLAGEDDEHLVQRGAWVRLGVDIAADGGDEFSISRSVGDLVHERHHSAGKTNADSSWVTDRVFEEILAAERLAAALGTPHQVRVKIDAIGLGWGVAGNLRRLGEIGKHSAAIIDVKVSEKPERADEAGVMRPYNKRAEMWLAGRTLLQPDPRTGEGRLRLRMSTKANAQLSSPNIGSMSASGLTVIESKASMKARGAPSPDRAESMLLAIYEPFPLGTRKRRGLIQG